MKINLSTRNVTYLAKDSIGLSRAVVSGASDEEIAALSTSTLSMVYETLIAFYRGEEDGTFVTFLLRVMALVKNGAIPYFTYRELDDSGNQLLCVCLGLVESNMGYPSKDAPSLLLKCLRLTAEGAKFDVRRLPDELLVEVRTVFLNLMVVVRQFWSVRRGGQDLNASYPIRVYRVNEGEALLVTWGHEDHLPDSSLAFLRNRGHTVCELSELSSAAISDLMRQTGLLYDMVGWFPELPNLFHLMEEEGVHEASRGDLLILTDLNSNLRMVGRVG